MPRRWSNEEVRVLVEGVDANYEFLTSAPSASITKIMVDAKWNEICRNIAKQSKAKQTSLFLTQVQLQQNELKLKTQNAQNREKNLKLVTNQINPVAEACRETAKGA